MEAKSDVLEVEKGLLEGLENVDVLEVEKGLLEGLKNVFGRGGARNAERRGADEEAYAMVSVGAEEEARSSLSGGVEEGNGRSC